ncbi:MAG: hypothetical protein AB7H86_10495 [Blastocatellales bacterium]
MSEKYTNPFNYVIDSIWASLPEKTADEIATFKKDVLTGFRDSVNWAIDEQIKWIDRHVDNARHMRDQYRGEQPQESTSNPS